jgi:hypothetical protein
VRLVLDNGEFRISASNVLNDPLQELASAARGLLGGGQVQTVHFWLEPDTYVLVLQPDDRREHLTIQLLHTQDTELHRVAGDIVAQSTLPLEAGCKVMLRALERCDNQSFGEVLAIEWRRVFPKELVREARDLLAARSKP